jgi:hypothetical protein
MKIQIKKGMDVKRLWGERLFFLFFSSFSFMHGYSYRYGGLVFIASILCFVQLVCIRIILFFLSIRIG